MKKFDCVIVGGSGFISENLVQRLLKSDYKMLVLGRTKPKMSQASWEQVDLSKPQEIQREKIEANTLVYLTGVKGRFKPESPEWQMQKQLTAPSFDQLLQTLNIACNRIISIGSSEEYGVSTSDEYIDETFQCHPLTSYGQFKLELYKNGQKWAQSKGRQFLHLRPFIVYGVGQDPNMFLGSIIDALAHSQDFKMTAGEQYRSFISVEQVAEIIENSLKLKSWPYDCVNISSSTYLQIIEVAKMVHQLIGKGDLRVGAIPYRDFEVWHQRPSLKRLHEIAPKLSLPNFEEDLKSIIKAAKIK